VASEQEEKVMVAVPTVRELKLASVFCMKRWPCMPMPSLHLAHTLFLSKPDKRRFHRPNIRQHAIKPGVSHSAQRFTGMAARV